MRSPMPEPQRLQEFLNDYMFLGSNAEIDQNPPGEFKSPVLLIGGDRDTHTPSDTMLEAGKMIPDSRLYIVPESDHVTFLDNPVITMAEIGQFLKKGIIIKEFENIAALKFPFRLNMQSDTIKSKAQFCMQALRTTCPPGNETDTFKFSYSRANFYFTKNSHKISKPRSNSRSIPLPIEDGNGFHKQMQYCENFQDIAAGEAP